MKTLADTRLFEQVRGGDLSARDRLYSLAYPRLRRIAASKMRGERSDHTLQPTALVGEFFMKFRGSEWRISCEDHLYGMAAHAMGQILKDYARVRNALKKIAPASTPAPANTRYESNAAVSLSMKTALEKLRKINPTVADTVWQRQVEGLTWVELSRKQNRADWLVRADFDFGIEWLSHQIT